MTVLVLSARVRAQLIHAPFPGEPEIRERDAFVKTTIHSTRTQILVIPPRGAAVPRFFRHPHVNSDSYCSMLGAIQRFRGQVYLEDASVTAQELTGDGRHVIPIDEQSWHIWAL